MPTLQQKEHPIKKVLIFYSSKSEPQLLDHYGDTLTYLQETDIEAEIIDVEEEKERAREHDVLSTPAVIVEREQETHRYIGIVDGLKPVLKEDIYGKTLLHQLGFKEGRRFARDHDLSDASKGVVKDALTSYLGENITGLELTMFDPDDPAAELVVQPKAGEDTGWHDTLEEFLGGVFTEVFDTGVMGAESECGLKDHDQCTFTVKKQGE